MRLIVHGIGVPILLVTTNCGGMRMIPQAADSVILPFCREAIQ
jgi:hypothetical protein